MVEKRFFSKGKLALLMGMGREKPFLQDSTYIFRHLLSFCICYNLGKVIRHVDLGE